MEYKLPLVPHICMAKNENALKVGTAIRTARKRRGLVQRHIAEHMKVNVAAVGNWEIGKNLPSTDNLLQVANFLRVDPTALTRGELIYLDSGENLADAEIISDGSAPPTGPMDVEVLGASYGGDDGDFSFNGEVQGFVRRLPGIANVRNVFATYVLSDSMVPRYEPGEIIYLGGREPTPGDHVVIELFPEKEGEVGKAFVKKLVRRTASQIIVEQYNPKSELTFDRYSVKNLWRVIPWKELVGF